MTEEEKKHDYPKKLLDAVAEHTRTGLAFQAPRGAKIQTAPTDVKLSWLTRLAVMLGLGSSSHAMTSAERREAMDLDLENYMRGKLLPVVRDGDVLPLVFYPNPILRTVSSPVEQFDDDLRQLVKSLGATMYLTGGVGLSAVQVGVPLRVFVAELRDIRKLGDLPPPRPAPTTATEEPGDASVSDANDFRVFVNPKIIATSPGVFTDIEGCLSLPNIRETLARPSWVEIESSDERGRPRVDRLEGWPARVALHELEHLDGKIFVDHLGAMQRRMIDKRVAKLRRSVKIDETNGQRRAARTASKGRGR